ncbi:MAG: glutamate--tRNA ligase [Alphaproteobacteria bacterium]|nr:glutamate--tRNA ligase [Alphaproteobacteria bacterium]
METRVRFAPSPTGFLHVGNIRVAIINFLYAQKTATKITKENGSKFFLRLDDTDSQRVKDEYREMIFQDMNWLGLKFDESFKQSDRLARYEQAKNQLIASGRLYECFETAEELSLQRKAQNASGVAPIYNRASLNLSVEQKNELKRKGLRPHYRFLLDDKLVSWNDKIKGKIAYEGRHFSDPVLIRELDENGFGVPTYTFCSVVDDIDYKITDIIRGEDHITNTAIQIQIFEALGAKAPDFAHLSLVKASEGKISKRDGGFDVKTLRNEGYEPISIINLLAQIGTSESIKIHENLDKLIEDFSFEKFSKSATNYSLSELIEINHKILQNVSYDYVLSKINENKINYKISEKLWEACKSNLSFFHEVEEWIKIFSVGFRYKNSTQDLDFLNQIIELLPLDTSGLDAWQNWLNEIKKISTRKGKDLFMPIRLALTGKEQGPELKFIINLLDRAEIISRLKAS